MSFHESFDVILNAEVTRAGLIENDLCKKSHAIIRSLISIQRHLLSF